MDPNLKHEDLLIKLRAKLNEDRIRLWEAPYYQADSGIPQPLQDLAIALATQFSNEYDAVLSALQELQLHSIDRSKAISTFEETGIATVRVRVTTPKEAPRSINVQNKLSVPGSELIAAVAATLDVPDSRVKLIFNGKIIKPTQKIEEQGIKNGVQIMALVMKDTPDMMKKDEQMYLEMQSTRDDATLLSEYTEESDDEDDEYMKVEDQSGRSIVLPLAERRSLLVGLALHARGRTALRHHDFPLALVLLLEADKELSDCTSSLLNLVDNYAVLQLDIAWCYVCLRAVNHASDVERRLLLAEKAFTAAYGEARQRLKALKGNNANERVLFMRLYLLRGIVAYHQNQRAQARTFLDKAQVELDALRVDSSAVEILMELGWSQGEARAGLRAALGDVDRAHNYLALKKYEREKARERHRDTMLQRTVGVCANGQPLSSAMVAVLVRAGFTRRVATRALMKANNLVGDAIKFIQEHQELLVGSDESSGEEVTASSDDSLAPPNENLVIELTAMGYEVEQARMALKLSRNQISGAVDLLVAGGGCITEDASSSNPSTSASGSKKRKEVKQEKNKKRKERDEALRRLKDSIQTDEEEHLDSSLTKEEDFLALYKSLL